MPPDSYSWDYVEGLIYSQKSTVAEELKEREKKECGLKCSPLHVTGSVDKTGLLSIYVLSYT
jgi:hypothetical protein